MMLVCGVAVFMSFFRIVDEMGIFVCVSSGQWREWMFFFVSWVGGIGNLLMPFVSFLSSFRVLG